MTGGHRTIGLAMALAVTAGIVWASTARLTPYPPNAGLLRLTWSARPERLETCRPQTEDELARLPTHMRQPVICTGESAAYRLEVRRDGVVLADRVVHGGGWQRDRPLYVFQEIAQPAGDASISVRFDRIEPSPIARAPVRADASGRFASDLPDRLTLERRFHFRPGAVILVTYDSNRRALVTVP